MGCENGVTAYHTTPHSVLNYPLAEPLRGFCKQGLRVRVPLAPQPSDDRTAFSSGHHSVSVEWSRTGGVLAHAVGQASCEPGPPWGVPLAPPQVRGPFCSSGRASDTSVPQRCTAVAQPPRSRGHRG